MVEPAEASGVVTPDPEPRQIAVYRTYLHLQSIAAERYSGALGGRLVLSVGFKQWGAELALATIIAGGAFLGIETDPRRLKAVVRNGACDFMVNTLDEALRVLKNELRKRTPLSAGLLGTAAEVLPEMAERGVQPDLIAVTSELGSDTGTSQQALDELVGRGAELLQPENAAAPGTGSAAEVIWTAENRQDLQRVDRIALDLLPAAEQVRRQWLERAAGYFYRQKPLERVLALDAKERVRLFDALKSAHSALPLQGQAVMRWQDSEGAEQAVPLA